MRYRLTEKQLHDAIFGAIIDEVRYIDPRYRKYGGKVEKTHWAEEYDQQPIRDGEKLRVYHGCDIDTAYTIATQGTSGKEYHPRTYSYESGMNPLGIFVTTDFETAKKFGSSNTGMCVVEFTADAKDLEAPVWNGQGTFFGQGTNPMPFNNKTERDAQKSAYRKSALETPDDSYFDYNKSRTRKIDMSHIRQSDKPELAASIFSNSEHQALFMGDLNPNMIKRVWVNLPNKDGYVSTIEKYVPMSRRDFVRRFQKRQNAHDGRVKNEKVFAPAENVLSFDDLVKHVYTSNRSFFENEEDARQGLKSIGMLSNPPSDYARTMIRQMLWPKQIIQLYGKGYFDDEFNRLGQ
ncbi:MAG: hypothetical protein J6Y37_08635 [Paludibacteraceae bacterium]|nr:hypothetical protein [Paludibacteraceae bacterium]